MDRGAGRGGEHIILAPITMAVKTAFGGYVYINYIKVLTVLETVFVLSKIRIDNLFVSSN